MFKINKCRVGTFLCPRSYQAAWADDKAVYPPYDYLENKFTLGDLACELQKLHSAYRDGVQELSRLIAHEQMVDDTPRQTPRWPWPGLPDVEALKKSGAANMTGIKGAALTRWANEQWQTAIDQKLSKLNARLIPRVNLAVSETGGEIALHADGVVVLSVIETEQDAPLIAAQWRQVLRTTSITPSLTAQKLLDRLLALRTTENPTLRQRIIDSDTKLEQNKGCDCRKRIRNQSAYLWFVWACR